MTKDKIVELFKKIVGRDPGKEDVITIQELEEANHPENIISEIFEGMKKSEEYIRSMKEKPKVVAVITPPKTETPKPAPAPVAPVAPKPAPAPVTPKPAPVAVPKPVPAPVAPKPVPVPPKPAPVATKPAKTKKTNKK